MHHYGKEFVRHVHLQYARMHLFRIVGSQGIAELTEVLNVTKAHSFLNPPKVKMYQSCTEQRSILRSV